MDDTEIAELFGQPEKPTVHLPSCNNDSMEDLIHELMSETDHHHHGFCTHVHTCNHPTGPDNTHTHTCFHVHTNTKLISPTADAETNDDDDDSVASESTETKSKKRPVKRKKGNREAVRKYREKKKARAASLEDEMFKLRAVNQHLLQRLKGQAALEAEVARLKCLLVDLRARIQGEISSFLPYQSSCALDVADPCDAVQCGGSHHVYDAHQCQPEKQ